MDASYRIYSAPNGEVPPEDKARLEGWLKGIEDARAAENAEGTALQDEIAARLRQLKEMER